MEAEAHNIFARKCSKFSLTLHIPIKAEYRAIGIWKLNGCNN